jgi:hypothetical protein
MIYVNGCSYTGLSTGNTVAEFLSKKMQLPFVNNSIRGSSNERILRSSMRDLISLNSDHKEVYAIIGLSFIFRTCVWDPIGQANKWKNRNDGEFASYQFFIGGNWFQEFLFKKTVPKDIPDSVKDYGKEWAILYDPEPTLTNLLWTLGMFSSWCEQNNIKYCIFFSPPMEEQIDTNTPFIKPFVDLINQKKNIIDLFNFSFLGLCDEHNLIGFDEDMLGRNAHQGEEGHELLANFLFDNYLKNYEF